MTRMEKALGLQLLAAVAAIVVVMSMLPFYGDRSRAGFAVLAIGGIAGFFFRRKQNEVVIDERDASIARTATERGITLGAGFLFFALVVLVSGNEQGAVSTTLLSWILWWTFTVVMFAKGLFGLIAYRKDRQSAA